MQATNDKEIEIEIVRERERTRELRIYDSNVHTIYLTVKCSVQSSTELTKYRARNQRDTSQCCSAQLNPHASECIMV